MGNQLTGIAPSEILPIERYFANASGHEFDISLGSTRFLKVARVKSKDGLTVAKVFVIHDPSLPVNPYKKKIEEIRNELQGADNCLSYQRIIVLEKVGFLFRQYVQYNLYDRISTRPFLMSIEKKWIAFQLLCAINHCHKTGVCHGDIKSENVLLNSWGWLLLADFASFKPTYLPENNPSDFNFFFDTSRRRTCYIAPERFVEGSLPHRGIAADPSSEDLVQSDVKQGDLVPAMDVFSVGCVIIELFTDGEAPFDLSKLLAYRSGEYNVQDLLDRIEDKDIKGMVANMINRDPKLRCTAEEYLIGQKGKAFPHYFYRYLKIYLKKYAAGMLTPDSKVARIKRDLVQILQHLEDADAPGGSCPGLILMVSLVTSCVRNLSFCQSKLACMDLLAEFSSRVSSDILLDRLLPYMIHFVTDEFPRVRAEALRTITSCLRHVKAITRSEANIFPEYLLPALSHLTKDGVSSVRVAYAECIASLAETAVRFLEMAKWESAVIATSGDITPSDEQPGGNSGQMNYDQELKILHDALQQKVVSLLTDPDNGVKRALLHHSVTRLCVFFGRQKASDVILSHVITFLNDKQDWQLRVEFFRCIVGVAAYVGWQSTSILKPLLQQGLCDPEEFVIRQALTAICSLIDQNLFHKPVLHELLHEIVPFLCHPNQWILQAAVNCIAAIAHVSDVAYVHCNVLPMVKPFLKKEVLQIGHSDILLSSLNSPVPRVMFDYVSKSAHIEKLFAVLHDRQRQRILTRPGHSVQYAEGNHHAAQMLKKLSASELTEEQEDLLLFLESFMLKQHQARQSVAPSEDNGVAVGILDIAQLKVQRRHADLPPKSESDGSAPILNRPASRKQLASVDGSAAAANEDWKDLFGGPAPAAASPSAPSSRRSTLDAIAVSASSALPAAGLLPGMSALPPANGPLLPGSVQGGRRPSQQLHPPAGSEINLTSAQDAADHLATPLAAPQQPPVAGASAATTIDQRYSQCKVDLREVIRYKRQQFAEDSLARIRCMEVASWKSRLDVLSDWKPLGILAAHTHEHRAAVNRILVSPRQTYFATCGDDGLVKIWQCFQPQDSNTVMTKSKATYNKQGGKIKSLAYCDSDDYIASLSDNGSIHITHVETGTPFRFNEHDRALIEANSGQAIDMQTVTCGSRNVLTYATTHGLLLGIDSRSKSKIWRLQNDPTKGVVMSLATHDDQNWLAVATSGGHIDVWDMRFQLLATSICHPIQATRVRRVIPHPHEPHWLIAATQGNNEISVWNLETGQRQKTLWASPSPVFSQKDITNHWANGLYACSSDSYVYLLSGGTDMRLRYWDFSNPERSGIVVHGALDRSADIATIYKQRLVEGSDVIVETYVKQKPLRQLGVLGALSQAEDSSQYNQDKPQVGHHDIITDVSLYQTSQSFVVTSSADGVVKVWK